jgi:phosphatidylglycerophosphate synthase
MALIEPGYSRCGDYTIQAGGPVAHYAHGAAIPGGAHNQSILRQSGERRESALRAALRAHLANLLSSARLALTVAWLARFATNPDDHTTLLAIAVLAALSDFFDGRLARRLGTASASGRWLDSGTDILFVLAALSCEAFASAIPVYVPILIAISFAQYACDSVILGRRNSGPIPSRLGHWGGIINYALVLVLSFAPAPALAGSIVRTGAPLLVVFYLAAIAERGVLLYRFRRR